MLQVHPGWIAAASEQYSKSFWTCFYSSSLPWCVSELSWLREWGGVDSRLWEGVGKSRSVVLYFKLSVLIWYLIQTLAAASSHTESPGSFFKGTVLHFKLSLCFHDLAERWLHKDFGLALNARSLSYLKNTVCMLVTSATCCIQPVALVISRGYWASHL